MKRYISFFFALIFCVGLVIPSYAAGNNDADVLHTIELQGQTFQILERTTGNGLKTFTLENAVPANKMHLAEMAMEMAADPDFDPYGVEPSAETAIVDVLVEGVEYYKRVVDEPSNAHATTMSTYECNNASYSNHGNDTISSDCSTAWYGSATPDTIKVEHKITFYVTGTNTKLQLTTAPSGALSFETTKSMIRINYELEANGTKLARINGASAIVHHPDLQGGHITQCVASTKGTSRFGNVQYSAQADVKFLVFVD